MQAYAIEALHQGSRHPSANVLGHVVLTAAFASSVERRRVITFLLKAHAISRLQKYVYRGCADGAVEKFLLNMMLANETLMEQRSDSIGTYLAHEGMKLWSVRPFAILATLVKSSLAVWMNPDPHLPQLRTHRR